MKAEPNRIIDTPTHTLGMPKTRMGSHRAFGACPILFWAHPFLSEASSISCWASIASFWLRPFIGKAAQTHFGYAPNTIKHAQQHFRLGIYTSFLFFNYIKTTHYVKILH
jgi:hypothetical protein